MMLGYLQRFCDRTIYFADKYTNGLAKIVLNTDVVFDKFSGVGIEAVDDDHVIITMYFSDDAPAYDIKVTAYCAAVLAVEFMILDKISPSSVKVTLDVLMKHCDYDIRKIDKDILLSMWYAESRHVVDLYMRNWIVTKLDPDEELPDLDEFYKDFTEENTNGTERTISVSTDDISPERSIH